MTQKEQIAKAIILNFNNEDGRNNSFFEAYDLMSQEEGFKSSLIVENNFQYILWELYNIQKEVQPFSLEIEYKKRPVGYDEIINQFLQ